MNRTSSDRSNIIADSHLPLVKRFCTGLKSAGKSFFLTDEIQLQLDTFLAAAGPVEPQAEKAIRRTFRGCPEILIDAETTYAVLRPAVGVKRIVLLHPNQDHVDEISRGEYLRIKDTYVQGHEEAAKRGLVLDFSPFFREFPKVSEPSEMGEGISFLNRQLAAQLYQNKDAFHRALLGFLKHRKLDGASILVNDHMSSPAVLIDELAQVRAFLEDYADDEPHTSFVHELRAHGFELGWGRTAATVAESLAALAKVMESSGPRRFESLLGRLPLIRTVVMVSPHGWFAQDSVLGRPDTGGQVTYVLDQARAIERQMRQQFYESGIDAQPRVVVLTRLIPNADGTTCNLPREKIHGTEDSWIVRTPFRDSAGEILPDWISRFCLWPYLEGFAEEAKQVVVTELLGKPDLIIGHYTDGNLVAHRLADDLNTTHCACVHALEKTKYLESDMYWDKMEEDYHFSLQYTADLIAYNSADFIVSSSKREVSGTPGQMSMVESYDMFSMPGLYRVQSGFDPRLARHNIVPPGASDQFFFPNTDESRRVEAVATDLSERFLGQDPGPDCVGTLADPDLPIVFALARMDKIKNLSGLVEIFGKTPGLKNAANLVIISSITDAALSSDAEEISEITRTYELIDSLQLDGHLRWCGARLNKVETGEIYRIVADRKGVFAQPAFMETFGLTVVEAMVCGLPVVVTCFGGPAEIVVHGECGEIQNPNDHAAFADALLRVVIDPQVWQRYAAAGVDRVLDNFTWPRHAEKVLRLANVHNYWNYIDVMNRQALDRYIHTLYHTVYRPRAQAMLGEEQP